MGAHHRRDLGGAHAAGRGQQDLGALAAGKLFGSASDPLELGALLGRNSRSKTDGWRMVASLERQSPAAIPILNPIHL
jgi:hypothetical protein